MILKRGTLKLIRLLKRVSAGLAILKRARALVPRDTLINMYNALFVPYANLRETAETKK